MKNDYIEYGRSKVFYADNIVLDETQIQKFLYYTSSLVTKLTYPKRSFKDTNYQEIIQNIKDKLKTITKKSDENFKGFYVLPFSFELNIFSFIEQNEKIYVWLNSFNLSKTSKPNNVSMLINKWDNNLPLNTLLV